MVGRRPVGPGCARGLGPRGGGPVHGCRQPEPAVGAGQPGQLRPAGVRAIAPREAGGRLRVWRGWGGGGGGGGGVGRAAAGPWGGGPPPGGAHPSEGGEPGGWAPPPVGGSPAGPSSASIS